MKPQPESKRRKVDAALCPRDERACPICMKFCPNSRTCSPHCRKFSARSDVKDPVKTLIDQLTNLQSPAAAQTSKNDQKIQQAKNFAVAQAQQECCTGNYRVFDSPFGNFLLPVIPTRAELGG